MMKSPQSDPEFTILVKRITKVADLQQDTFSPSLPKSELRRQIELASESNACVPELNE